MFIHYKVHFVAHNLDQTISKLISKKSAKNCVKGLQSSFVKICNQIKRTVWPLRA